MYSYGKTYLEELLLRIDYEAYLELGDLEPKPKIIVAGGSALLLSELTARKTTHDIDCLAIDSRLRSIISRFHILNSKISAYCDSVPYNFDQRLMRLEIPTRLIDYMILSQEDIAVMKLYGWRPNDQEDLNSPDFIKKLNWALLDHLVFSQDEARASILSEHRYKEMRDLYIIYARRHGYEPKF